jgi:hypothetical protein
MENTLQKPRSIKLSSKTKEWLVFVICLLSIFLFLYTAYAKLSDHKQFAYGLKQLPIIGRIASVVSWLIPITEVIIAVLMIIPRTVKFGLFAFTTLMALFSGYIISLMLLGLKLPCYCGGVIESMNWTQHVWFNLMFITLGITAIFINKTNK